MTDHLWQIGFNLLFKVERLALPIVAEGQTFPTQCKLEAFPERGEARRHFAGAGPAVGSVYCNLDPAFFDVDHLKTKMVKDGYRERCAMALFDLLIARTPTLRKPDITATPEQLASAMDVVG